MLLLLVATSGGQAADMSAAPTRSGAPDHPAITFRRQKLYAARDFNAQHGHSGRAGRTISAASYHRIYLLCRHQKPSARFLNRDTEGHILINTTYERNVKVIANRWRSSVSNSPTSNLSWAIMPMAIIWKANALAKQMNGAPVFS